MINISISDIKGITLLAVGEAEKLPLEILKFNSWWWLQTPIHDGFRTANVCNNGLINYGGSFVNSGGGAIRPALIIDDLESRNLKVGDIVEVFDNEWYYVGDSKVLAKTLDLNEHCNTSFYSGEDWPNFWDKYQFEDSDIYKLLHGWLKEKKSQCNVSSYTMSSSYIGVNDNSPKGIHIDINDISIGDYVAVIDEDPFGEYQLHLEEMSFDLISKYIDGKVFTDLIKATQKWNELNARSEGRQNGTLGQRNGTSLHVQSNGCLYHADKNGCIDNRLFQKMRWKNEKI